MLEIIASNFLKIGNGWTIVEKYANTVVYVETHFYANIKTAFFFFYIYGPMQVVSCDQWHCFDVVEIR